jgi:hypothetical protein
MAGIGLLSAASLAVAGLPGDAGTTGRTGSSVAATSPASAAASGTAASGTGTAGSATASRTGTTRSGANLLCAGLLGSGVLGNVLTVAPLTTATSADPRTAIKFSKIWSDTQHATVSASPPAAASPPKPVVATVKLPIAFSADDRQKFEAAGWQTRAASAGGGATYCLTPASQGMICVQGGP